MLGEHAISTKKDCASPESDKCTTTQTFSPAEIISHDKYKFSQGELGAYVSYQIRLQPADIGWPTGNGNKLRCSQAQLGQATCLGAA